MASPGTTIVYPKPGVTLYLPGGVHGFTAAHGSGIPMPTKHAEAQVFAGHLDTDDTRAAASALAAAKAKEAAAQQTEATAAAAVAAASGATPRP